MKAKKVTIVTSYAPSSISFRGELISALVEKGCCVQVLAPDHSAETKDRLRLIGASSGDFFLSRSGASPFLDLRSLYSILRIFCSDRPDVVLTYFVKPNIWGIIAAAMACVPKRIAMVEGMGYCFTPNANGYRSLKQLLLGWLILRLYQLAFMAANRVIVLNSDDINELYRKCGLKPSKTVLLGGIGVSLDQWNNHHPHLSPITFTMVARLLREKGVFEFLNAARLIKSEFPCVRFLLLGGLDDNPGAIGKRDLQPWIEMGCVDILGHVEVLPHLRITSVFVLPSYREGMPRSTQEAMAMGRAVITTDAPGCRETVLDNVNGFLVPPRDSSALAQAMKRFIMRPEMIAQMGRESRRLAEERFDVHRANAKLMEVLGV
jgi:glycosyltransferase involved in cell wall biosynthesis